jgi:hypothetical protein
LQDGEEDVKREPDKSDYPAIANPGLTNRIPALAAPINISAMKTDISTG